MEQIVLELAKQSPVAVVAVVAIWRMSIVMITMANGLVAIATSKAVESENGDKKGQ